MNYSIILAGRGVAVRQYRQNDNCSGLEELQPIDENTNYDFDFQQFTRLPREVKIMPVGLMIILCIIICISQLLCFFTGRFY